MGISKKITSIMDNPKKNLAIYGMGKFIVNIISLPLYHITERKHCKAMQKIYHTKKNERCFVIGNGPSLLIEDLEKLKKIDTFGLNRIYELYDKTDWRPKYYCSGDLRVLTKYNDMIYKHCKNTEYNFLPFPFPYRKKYLLGNASKMPNTRLLRIKYPLGTSNDTTVKKNISSSCTSFATIACTAIQIAIHMGYNEIYLIGVDQNFKGATTHAKGMKSEIFGVDDLDKAYFNCMETFQKIKEFGDEHGIKIYNATRGGMLEVFPRVNFDEIELGV